MFQDNTRRVDPVIQCAEAKFTVATFEVIVIVPLIAIGVGIVSFTIFQFVSTPTSSTAKSCPSNL